MDAPPVQYARTEDGVSIAYAVHGSGPSLVYLSAYSHLDMDWRVPEFRAWMERLGSRWRVIRYDARGFGLSEKVGDEPRTRAGYVSDARAVLEAASVDRALLVSRTSQGTDAAVILAHDLRDRWSSLVLWHSNLTGIPPIVEALLAVEKFDADVFTRTLFLWYGWEDAASRRLAMEAYAASRWPEMRRARGAGLALRMSAGEEAQELVAALEIPALIMSRRDCIAVLTEEGIQIAQTLPGAKRLTLEGSEWHQELGDSEAVALALEEFDAERLGSVPRDSVPASFQTILFTDLESSTALTQRVGDEAAQEVLRGHNSAVRGALEAHDGREVKHTGDGIMASFPSAVSAVEASLAIQQELEGGEVRVRIGINAGEPIAEDDDLFGTAVQLAARITDRAKPGQVLVSNVVRELCAGKTFAFTSAGDATMKGFDEPVALYQVTV
ncbi:MAG TPA: adenylate/guanylate cyclase domain-containing protein [Dehalococcoidia bacterium]|nr:adenylate/guanylate cyclase domain-containing protein [Dehalococcoidia bacterium]